MGWWFNTVFFTGLFWRRESCPTEELETERFLVLTNSLCHLMRVPAAMSLGESGRHSHHRDSNADLVSKDEEKLGIRKVRLGLSLNSHEGFKSYNILKIFERIPQ